MKPISKRKREEILTQIANNKWDGSDSDFSLKYADARCKADKEIVIAYLKHDHSALRHVSEDLLNDKEVILTAMITEYEEVLDQATKGHLTLTMIDPSYLDTYKYWASDRMKALVDDFSDGVIEGMKKAVEMETEGHTLPTNISLTSYLQSLELANELQISLTANAEQKQTKRLKI